MTTARLWPVDRGNGGDTMQPFGEITMQSRLIGGFFIAVLILGIASHASAGQMGHGHHGIHLENAWARRTPPMAQQEQGGHGGSAMNPDNSAVYVTISNHQSEADALVSATTDIATAVELHETIERDGKMVMQPRLQFDVPAGGTLAMKPGSYHIMLLGLKQALQPGDTVNVTLTFEKAGQMSVEAPVK
jgi:copper(I)-binding protein